MGRKPFWTNKNMGVAAWRAMKLRGLKSTLELKKAFRYHYQRLADAGLFKAPTTRELAQMGIDTSKWNDGEGWLPSDLKKKWTDYKEGKITKKDMVETVDDTEPVDIDFDTVPEPNLKKGKSHEAREVNKIIKAGNHFKKEDAKKDDKPEATGRLWKGEHWNPVTHAWELPAGKWFDPGTRKWNDGSPRLEPFYWIYEFLWDPSKYEEPCPLGLFHQTILEKMDEVTRAVIKVGRDHLKSTIFSRGYLTYNICERPNVARMGMLNIAWDNGLAEDTFQGIVEELENNEKILSFYGYLVDEDRPKTQEKIFFTYSPVGARFGLRCTSFKSGSITGMHPSIVIIDDPQDEPLTLVLMEKFRRIVNKKILPAVGKTGKVFVIGTTKGWDHRNDVYLWLEKNKTWTILSYPAADRMPAPEDISIEKRTRPAIDKYTKMQKIDERGELVFEEYLHIEVKKPESYRVLYPERFTIEDLVRKRLEMQGDDKSDDDFWSEYFLIAANPRGKYFIKDRIRAMPPPGYYSTREFVAWCNEPINSKPIFLFADPGGAKSHGIAVVVGTFVNGRFFFLDFVIIRAGPSIAAETIARLIVEWNITQWACESNFDQGTVYADVLDQFVHEYMERNDLMKHYSPVIKKNNTGEKYQRIQTHISNMIGLEGQDYLMYVNRESNGYSEFDKQVSHFGLSLPKTREHDFDLLDAAASMKIHLFSYASSRVIARAY